MTYKELYLKFSTNSENLPVSRANLDRGTVTLSTARRSDFRKTLLKAVKICAKAGLVDILETENGIHSKTESFLEALMDQENPLYAPLREVGFEDERDVLNSLTSQDFLTVKSESDPSLGIEMSVYYEYRIVREDIDLYVKLVFQPNVLAVDIHGENENYSE